LREGKVSALTIEKQLISMSF